MASGYMNGSAKTLDHTLLGKLFKGNASISLLPYNPSTGVEGFDSLDFSGADEIYTIQDSFQISQGDATSTEIKIDQKNETIDTTTEAGEWTIAGNIPAIATAILDVFYNAVDTAVTGVKGQADGSGTTAYAGKSYEMAGKEVYATMLVENEAKNLAVCFAKVKMTVGFAKDDSTNPAYLKLAATILANDASAVGDWAVVSR